MVVRHQNSRKHMGEEIIGQGGFYLGKSGLFSRMSRRWKNSHRLVLGTCRWLECVEHCITVEEGETLGERARPQDFLLECEWAPSYVYMKRNDLNTEVGEWLLEINKPKDFHTLWNAEIACVTVTWNEKIMYRWVLQSGPRRSTPSIVGQLALVMPVHSMKVNTQRLHWCQTTTPLGLTLVRKQNQIQHLIMWSHNFQPPMWNYQVFWGWK